MATKINQLVQLFSPDTVATVPWLARQGIDRRLADKYVRSGWLQRLGHGAYQRTGATVDWPGALHTLQTQLGLAVHPGAITAFELRGYAQYLAVATGGRPVVLFGRPGTKLPAWFTGHQWSRPVQLVTTGALPHDDGEASPVRVDGIQLSVATPERAAFELMYLVPQRQAYEEALQVMESLTTLRPQVVQQLLMACTSVKTKRLFMHAAERLQLPWLQQLDLSRVDFGAGRRTIHAGGRLDSKYDLVVDDPAAE
jgi:hypothetical protein